MCAKRNVINRGFEAMKAEAPAYCGANAWVATIAALRF